MKLVVVRLGFPAFAGAAKPSDFSRVIVDTTVQPKVVAHPTDAKLMHIGRASGWSGWRRRPA